MTYYSSIDCIYDDDPQLYNALNTQRRRLQRLLPKLALRAGGTHVPPPMDLMSRLIRKSWRNRAYLKALRRMCAIHNYVYFDMGITKRRDDIYPTVQPQRYLGYSVHDVVGPSAQIELEFTMNFETSALFRKGAQPSF